MTGSDMRSRSMAKSASLFVTTAGDSSRQRTRWRITNARLLKGGLVGRSEMEGTGNFVFYDLVLY